LGLLERTYWALFTAWNARDEHRLPFRQPAAVLGLQNRRVRAIVRHAWQTVPFYREAMRSQGIDPRDIRTAGDLRRLPLISGADLRRDPTRFRSSRYRASDVLELHSTGTTGEAKSVAYDHRALFLALAGGMRQRYMLGRLLGKRGGYREMTIARRDSVSHPMRELYRSRSWSPPWIDLERESMGQDVAPDAAVERINRFRPDTLFAMGAHVGALYRWAHERGIDLFRPRAVFCGGDRMADSDRELLESELGVAVVSTYQAVEALRLGFQCELRRGFHLSLDAVAVRVVDDRGADVGPGEAGELVVSNLTNRATVLLNYRLGDRVAWEREPCPCGRTLPTIQLLQGRPSEGVLMPDGSTLHAGSILEVLQAVAGLRQVQLEQEALRSFRLRAVCERDADSAQVCAQLAAAARSVLGDDIAVRVTPVDRIAPGPGGKVRPVISRCLEEGAAAKADP